MADSDTYVKLRHARQVIVGTNQTTKALEQKTPVEVYVAKDAERRVVAHIVAMCRQKNVPVVWVDSMKNLGTTCGIEVAAAAVAVMEY